MSQPEDIPTTEFTDERIAMEHWFPMVKDSDIPTPETHAIPLEPDEDNNPTWDTDRVIEIVESLGGEAFVRTDFKSSRLRRGQHIQAPTEREVDITLSELLSSMVMMQLPIGGGIYIREWLDLEWDHYTRGSCHPEARFFIRNGEPVCWHLRTEFPDDAQHSPEEAKKFIDPNQKDYPNITEELHTYADKAAKVFPDDCYYSVDFVLTTDYDWYLTDAAVDALYKHDEKGWINISDHPDHCEHNLERQFKGEKEDSTSTESSETTDTDDSDDGIDLKLE